MRPSRVRSCLGSLILLSLVATLVSAAPELGVYKVSPDARNALLDMHAIVDHGRADGAIVARLTPAQVEELRRRGVEVDPLYGSIEEQRRAVREQPQFDQFRTFDQMRSDFVSYAAAHPQIARYVVFGHSVQNRELFGLCISSHPEPQADLPEVVIWGGIHGDEFGGAEMPYRYALYLCDHYGTDPAVTRRVDEDRIWCIPMINPDGHVLNTRENANGVDLNRDLGYEWAGEGESPAPFSQVETRAVREFCASHDITLSLTFHCSGDYVLYPWGCAPQNVPDYPLTVGLTQAYANAASYTYVNSWQDYETHGEVLDYVYGSHGGICLTVEVSNSAALIAQTFARNQAGMNLFCDLAGEGLHGMISDAQTGEPLAASVWMNGNPIPAYSDPQVGGLHREVPPGTYDLTVWAPGYLPKVISGVNVASGAPGAFQAALTPGTDDCAFRVVSVDQRDPNHVHANTTFPSAALGAPDGIACSLGSSGFIVLDMGEGQEIVDRPGADLEVVEAITPADPLPEAYRVYGGDAYAQSVPIGSGVGTTSFDLAGSGLASVRYLKIVDASGAPPNGPHAGMDLDAVIGNLGTTDAPEPIGVSAGDGLPMIAAPNPFGSATSIRFTLTRPSPVVLSVFDALGRRVSAPMRFPSLGPGRQEVWLDGSRWSAGTYFYRLSVGSRTYSAAILRIK